MAATLLAPGRSVLTDMPDILDIATMGEILRRLGCGVEWNPAAGVCTIDVPDQPLTEAPYELVRQIRAAITLLGPLTTRLGEARIPLPGGDAIGSRPVDFHIAGLQRMGADVTVEHGFIVARAGRLLGAQIWLDFPSVTGTENLVLAATLAKGTTTIDNCAQEPEVVDLCDMLIGMGARIDGAGSPTITVEGVETLSPVTHAVVPDRIVAGTWAVAAAITRGDVLVHRGNSAHLRVALDKVTAAGAVVVDEADGFRVTMADRPRSVEVSTLPYPGFPTDLQPLAILLNAVASGSAVVTENLYEGRFAFVDELARLGADVKTTGHYCIVHGRERLSSAPVQASDIRAGTALVLAGLVADGITEVHEVHHIDRGYASLLDQLGALGADVTRVTR
jgi:UDP-N-acetylglucosamine 1-carboxyvinyltransferase